MTQEQSKKRDEVLAAKMAEQLRECPFCGGNAEIKERYLIGVANKKNYWVVCGKCQAQINQRNSIKRATEAWNRRTGENKDG